jgi:tetratricopeptide (TPR) repeat protein
MLCTTYDNPAYHFDLKILNALKNTSSGDFNEGYNSLKVLKDFQGRGMIFSKSDLSFYTGFTLFYSGRYEEARYMFDQAMSEKYSTGEENLNLEQESLRQMLFEDEPEEEDDLTTGQTFTKIEMLHNIALCYIMENKYDEAIEHLEKMINVDTNNPIY